MYIEDRNFQADSFRFSGISSCLECYNLPSRVYWRTRNQFWSIRIYWLKDDCGLYLRSLRTGSIKVSVFHTVLLDNRFHSELSNSTNFNNDVIHGLTSALILHPIGLFSFSKRLFINSCLPFCFFSAAALAALAVIFGLCGTAYSRAGTIFMTLVTTLAALVTLVAWVIDMVRSLFKKLFILTL